MIHNIKNTYASLDEQYPTHTKVLRFLIAGGIAVSVDLGLLYLFTDIFGIWYLLSSVLAFILAFLVSFTLQKFWTFRDRERAGMHSQMGIYFLISVSNLCLNTLIVYFGVDVVGLHYLVAQIIASLLIACGSFFIYQRFVFRPTSV